MKKSTLIALLLSSGLMVQATGQDLAMSAPRQQQQPTRQQPLLDVLKQLEERHGVVFDYNRRDLRDKTAPPARPASASLEVVLQQLLTPNGLAFEKNNSRSYLIYNRDRRKLAPATTSPALRPQPDRRPRIRNRHPSLPLTRKLRAGCSTPAGANPCPA